MFRSVDSFLVEIISAQERSFLVTSPHVTLWLIMGSLKKVIPRIWTLSFGFHLMENPALGYDGTPSGETKAFHLIEEVNE